MSRRYALVGLSDAGKSTWLGALCDVLEDARGDVRMRGERGNFLALDHLRNALLEGRYPAHTAVPDLIPTRLELSVRGEPVDVDITDYSGERLKQLYRRTGHAWDQGWEQRAECTHLAVLLRADSIRALSRVAPVEAAVPFDADLVPDPAESERRHPPTALTLVEALQVLRARRGFRLGEPAPPGTERIAVVLTAWDAVQADPDAARGPRDYLRRRASLLSTWLDTNLEPGAVEVFGLSATGGALGDSDHAARVRRDGLSRHAYTVHGSPGRVERDAALPLRWLLGR